MKQFLEDFCRTVENNKARLLDIPAEEAGRSAQDKWSTKQIIGHLIDSACNNHQRFVRAQLSNDLVCSGYDQEAWVSCQKYNDETWPDLVHLWAAYNLHLLHVISVIPEDVLTRIRKEHNLDQIAFKAVSRNTPTTLEYFVRDYVDHMRHHLAQIFGKTAGTNA